MRVRDRENVVIGAEGIEMEIDHRELNWVTLSKTHIALIEF